MALSRSERFTLKSRLIDVINDGSAGWDFTRKNLLLSEFGFETMSDDGWHGPGIEDLIAKIPDGDLIEMYSLVTGIDQEEVVDAVESADSGNWKPGYVRLFLSHSAVPKKFIGEIADELAVVGIHGFVAHDTMEVSKPWQSQIEQALRSMRAFVAIIHPEFNGSAWCHQEVGWALGRRVPRYAIRMGVDPAGFIGRDQWPAAGHKTAKEVAAHISSWVATVPELGDLMVDGLLNALASAGNYMEAGATAERIASLDSLTEDQFKRLNGIWWQNDQLYGGYLPSQAMEPFYLRNGREWPPPKPAQSDVPWIAASFANTPQI